METKRRTVPPPALSNPGEGTEARTAALAAVLGSGVLDRTGFDYLRALVDRLCTACDVDYAFVGRRTADTTRIESVAVSHKGATAPNFTYDLAGTPCATVLGRGHCAFPRGVQALFPDDHMLVEMNLEAYVGVPLVAFDGTMIGILVLLHTTSIDDVSWVEQLAVAAAARVSAELEREDMVSELRASEVRLAALFEQAPGVAIRVFEPDGRTIRCNRAAADMFGFDRDTCPGKTARELGSDEDEIAWLKDAFTEVNRTRHAYGPVRRTFARPGGATGICLSTLFLVPWTRTTEAIVRIDSDATELENSLAALNQSRSLFEAIFHQTFQFIGLLDKRGIVLEANRTALEFAGVAPEEVFGKPFWETPWWRHSPELQAQLRLAVERAAAGEMTRLEVTHPAPDGALHHVDFSIKPFRGEDGSVTLLIPEGRDITDRKRTEDALQRSEARFRAIAESMFDAHYEWDASTSSVWRSPSYRRLAGYVGTDDATYEWWRERVHPADLPETERTIRKSLAAHRNEIAVRYRFRVGDGAYRTLDDRMFAEFSENGRAARIVGAITDVTDSLAAAAERAMMEERIRASQKLESLGLLAGGIAHDFNNFLAGILGYASLAEMDVPPESKAKQSLAEIQLAVQHAAELTRQMLAYSGRGAFVVEPMTLNGLVEDMHPLVSKVISRKAELEFELASAPVRADAAQMRQIVLNLLTNASDALLGAVGKIHVRTGTRSVEAGELTSRFEEGPLPSGTYAFLEVQDTGVGMDAATVNRIFDPFFTTKATGRGLGLAAVLGIVRGHRGSLQVESAVGAGTTFRMWLPVFEAGRTTRRKTPSGETLVQTDRGCVLVVEDEDYLRRLATVALERAGFVVHSAFDGRDGIETFVDHGGDFDAVVLDLTMPRLDGWEVLREIRKKDAELPVLLTSGFSRPARPDDLDESVGYEFLAKPYTVRELVSVIRQMVTSARDRRGDSGGKDLGRSS